MSIVDVATHAKHESARKRGFCIVDSIAKVPTLSEPHLEHPMCCFRRRPLKARQKHFANHFAKMKVIKFALR